jgi:hypothetical protein
MTDLRRVLDTLAEFGDTFDKVVDNPNVTPITKTAGDADAALAAGSMPSMRKVLSATDRMLMQRELMKLDTSELVLLFGEQLQKHDRGIPVSHDPLLLTKMADDPYISKVLDTTSGSALQRQDLEPILWAIYIKAFPAYQKFPKVPANGVVHAWRQITSYGDAQFMTELGTVTDDNSTYVPQTTNIAQLATRRGVTFKEQLAVPAGGMSWNPQQIEIEGGLTAMAHKMQKTIFQGQASNSGGTASNELGLYDPNGFTGLRSILNTNNAINVSPYLTSNPDSLTQAFGQVVIPITNAGGTLPDVIYARPEEAQRFSDQQLAIQRVVDRQEFVPGVQVPAVMTSAGMLPIVSVPGDSIGTYVTDSSSLPTSTVDGKTVADMYALSSNSVVIPYLGSPGPSVLEIPPGVSGQLTRLFIVYLFGGLAVLAIPFNNKARVNQAVS